ncbi:TPA: hypothetical protein EYP38_00800, partial [Candidatus Micrarchaeota archaeon]|nr:hypothetical protein [Candidatus Micrarchaeota archaeon]
GFDGLVKVISKYTPERVESVCGTPAHLIRRAARTMASAGKGSLLWGMGVTQQVKGVKNATALATLAALLGWYGKEGTCVGGVRGQNNVQGACDMGALANFYPGYVEVEDKEGRRRIAELWGVSELPEEPGLTVVEMGHAAETGKLKVLYVMGENLVVSNANSRRVERGLSKLEFLVVQDIFLTETARLADIVLPAAAMIEKEGSVTNTERRVQWTRKAVEPPGSSKADLEILVGVAKMLGLERFFQYGGPEDVLAEVNRVVPAYAGITPERLKSRLAGSCGHVRPPSILVQGSCTLLSSERPQGGLSSHQWSTRTRRKDPMQRIR